MADFNITKGFHIRLAGKPLSEVSDHCDSNLAALYPLEFPGVKQRLKVKEGDTVKRGTELLEDKRNERFKLCAPAGGTVKSIVRGARRFVEKIIIEINDNEQAEQFTKYRPEEIANLEREEILSQLLRTGYLAFIIQRPFSGIADVGITPKAVFVNGMNTAPFQVDSNTVTAADPDGFRAGLDLMKQLTGGMVHLCVPENAGDALKSVRNVQLHTFTGPHPAGNSSVHISRIDPMKPTDVVWTVRAPDVALIGRLFLDGILPTSKIVALGGSGVKEEGCRHYRMRIGGELGPLLSKHLAEGEQRVISGDVLSGTKIEPDGHLRFYGSSVTVIPEGRERRFLGWTMPGFNVLSFTRTFASSWLGSKKQWRLNTNRNGDTRAMVLTGHYDKVMPLDIMVDFLVRAVLAGDTDEAIRLGILETDPEDFALCDFVCPSKTEFQDIIRKGLEQIEEEGI